MEPQREVTSLHQPFLNPIAEETGTAGIQGGIGGADTKFYVTQSGCVQPGACTTINEYIASANHVQVHLAGGVRIFVTSNVFIRPQVDVHYVHNYQQFGSNWAPQFMISVGYESGEH